MFRQKKQRYAQPLLPLVQHLEELGYSMKGVLADCHLTREDLLNDSRLITEHQELLFYHCLNRQIDEPGLALRLGVSISVRSMGPSGYASLACRTVKEALELLKHYRFLTLPYLRWDTFVDGERLVHRLTDVRGLGSLRIFMMELALASLLSSTDEILGEHHQPLTLTLSYPDPGYKSVYQDIFGVMPVFDSPNTEISCSAAVLNQPLVGADPMVKEALEGLCKTISGRMVADYDVVEDVLALLRQAPPQLPAMDVVASRLGVSSRALRNQLEKGHMSYRKLQDQVRQERAVQLLSDLSVAMPIVATQCGFSDIHSFYPAFKRWTGLTPVAYRNTLSESKESD